MGFYNPELAFRRENANKVEDSNNSQGRAEGKETTMMTMATMARKNQWRDDSKILMAIARQAVASMVDGMAAVWLQWLAAAQWTVGQVITMWGVAIGDNTTISFLISGQGEAGGVGVGGRMGSRSG